MKVLLLIGDQPRHFHIANKLLDQGLLSALVVEGREAFVPEPPVGLDAHLKGLWVRHFEGRDNTERKFFPSSGRGFDEIPSLRVTREELNSAKVWAFLDERKTDLALTYGVHFLRPETLAHLPETCWNLHGGLSPWYRGAITLFWPSYVLEPQMTGMTVHQLTQRLDGGPIVHHVAGPLVRGDGIHELACQAVAALSKELPLLVSKFERGELADPAPQRTSGKLWLGKDWRPEHLRLIYDFYDNRIVDAYLDGKFQRSQPELVRQV